MRLAPAALLYSYDLNKCLKMCAESSRTTHQAQEAVEGCELLGVLIHGALQQSSKEELLSLRFIDSVRDKLKIKWSENIDEIANGSYKKKDAEEIKSSGYVVHTLEAAIWAFYHTTSFADGLIKVVNLGDDADTTGAVYGQLAGAFYGLENIPGKWIKKLTYRQKLEDVAIKLLQLQKKLL